jgi:hypothetical protein
MKRAVLGLKERLPDTTFLCLSNSNEVYISTILEVRYPLVWEYAADALCHPPILQRILISSLSIIVSSYCHSTYVE